VKAARPVAVRRVIGPDTVDVLTDLLKGVVRRGTGGRAAVTGYTVAGKTGTAQKIDATGHYSMVDHVASFLGFVPAARPALVILVSLDTPRGEHNEGGDVAAPVFARIAEQALAHLAVPPEDPDRALRMVAYRPETSAVAAAYHPTPLAPAPVGPTEPTRMPDLRGLSAREAATLAARQGLIVELKGSGWVVAQAPAPGTELEAVMACVLTLSRSSGGEGTPVGGLGGPESPPSLTSERGFTPRERKNTR